MRTGNSLGHLLVFGLVSSMNGAIVHKMSEKKYTDKRFCFTGNDSLFDSGLGSCRFSQIQSVDVQFTESKEFGMI